jgi:hypothetical protein
VVRGLDRFASHFAAHREQYVLIGGTALVVAMEEAGLPARATKDLDIVLCLEALDPSFVEAFWKFIELGRYEIRECAEGKRVFYRFQKPEDKAFPEMLELFSRKPEVLAIADGQQLTPIPSGSEMDSLSAILLDDDYYDFLHAHKREAQGGGFTVPIVDQYGLIALKAHAWIKLSAEKDAGGKVDSNKIDKHRKDVLRLLALVDPDERITAPRQICRDLARFLDALDPEIDLKPFGGNGKAQDAKRILEAVFATDRV